MGRYLLFYESLHPKNVNSVQLQLTTYTELHQMNQSVVQKNQIPWIQVVKANIL